MKDNNQDFLIVGEIYQVNFNQISRYGQIYSYKDKSLINLGSSSNRAIIIYLGKDNKSGIEFYKFLGPDGKAVSITGTMLTYKIQKSIFQKRYTYGI